MENIYASPVGIVNKDIYIIRNDINTKVYIGQSKDIEERFRSHCKNKNSNSLLDNAIQKYGKQHFWYDILEEHVADPNDREKYWIKYYNSIHPFGYNIQAGGDKPPIVYGDEHPFVKISDTDVKRLKDDLLNTNLSLGQLAQKYNISKKHVMRINSGISRASVDEKYPIREIPNINGKLTEEDVDRIIELLAFTYRFNGDIAREFGVEAHAIDKINNGITHHRDDVQYPIRCWKSCGKIPVTYEQVTDIIDLLLHSELSIRTIAKKYNIAVSVVYEINRGNSKKYYRDNLSYPLRPF